MVEGPWLRVQISIFNFQSALHLIRVHPDSSFASARASIQSGASQLINLRGSVDGQHPERQKLKESWLILGENRGGKPAIGQFLRGKPPMINQ